MHDFAAFGAVRTGVPMDAIFRDGLAISQHALEEVLATHPAIEQAAVVGVPDATHGEEVKAVLILRLGREVEADEVIQWCKRRLPDDQYPRIVEFTSAFPISPTGQLMRWELQKNAS